MASLWMTIGVNEINTGSMDLYFDGEIHKLDYDYAYIGSADTDPSMTVYPQYYTWNTGSDATRTSRNLQMYTPLGNTPSPNSTRGKLYFVKTSKYSIDSSLPLKWGFVSLNQPTEAGFYVVTPSLNASILTTTNHIAIYAFEDIDDLFANGWRCQNGTSTESSPLILKAKWDLIVNSTDWDLDLGLNVNDPDPNIAANAKAQVVACTLAYTPTSKKVQLTYIESEPIIKGAVIIAGEEIEPWGASSFDSYGGIVPFIG